MEESINFAQEIESLYRLHYITKEHDHIIELKRGEWRLFEPSKFIYAYFTFNSLYNFDWEESLKRNSLIDFSELSKEQNIENVSEGQKYKAMIDFIFERIEKEDEDKFFSIIFRRGKNTAKNIIDAVSKITPDSRITESERESFKKELAKMLEEKKIQKGKLKNDIVRFIYLVRNNIFHGTKTTIEMSESFQRERLQIYTNILIAINELLFRVLEKNTEFKIYRAYNLSELFNKE